MSTTSFDQRRSGIPAAGKLPWGSHFCVFYASERELLELLVPYVKAGLEDNECCSWEVRAPLTVETARRALREAVPGFAAYQSAGQIELATAPDDSAQPAAADALERRLDVAILAGFDGLRLVRCADGMGGEPTARGADTIRRLNIVAAFLYPRASFRAVDLMQVVQGHRFALVHESGRWAILEGSEARITRDALERSEEKLQSLFRNMSEGFAYHRIVLDAQGQARDYIFLEVNPAFERLTGLPAEKLLGRRVTQVLPGIESDPSDWIGRYGRVALTGEPAAFESHSAALDRWFAVSVFSAHKGYFGVTFSDITDRKRAEMALQRANARLEEEDRRKNQFMAVLSHELRNPLAPIRNSLYILERAAPGGDQARRAQTVIERQVGQLTRLVDDLLDVTRITRNKIHLQRQRLDLNEVVRRTVEDQGSIFEKNGVHLEVELAPAGVFAVADWERLGQVVGNLLQNAAKFTARGGSVRVSVATDPGSQRAVLRVADTGIGMEPETLARLFQPFVQADQALDRSKGGLGLGLALVKGLVELHGGEVSAHSDGLGKGAEFEVRLPLDLAGLSQPAAARVGAPRKSRRVLVIEDNVDAAESLREALELGDHQVAVAYNGPEGLAKAKAVCPEVVLCDIGLSGMDGYEVARAFKANDRLKGCLLVALSGYALSEDLQRADEAGFQGHLAKPANLEQLEAMLAALGGDDPADSHPSRANALRRHPSSCR